MVVIEAPARLRLDVACNDPDNGLFAGRAEQINAVTWDGELIEFEANGRAPVFYERPGALRICRRNWPILASQDWYGNWCWNAYWLTPSVMAQCLATIHKARHFRCSCGPSVLYDNWNEGAFDEALWSANLWGRHSIGEAA